MVCVECVEGGPLYSLDRSVPAITSYGNISNRPLVDQINLLAKMQLDMCLSTFGRTCGLAGSTLAPVATVFLWYTAWWVLMSDGQCRGLVGRFGLVCGPPFVCVTPDAIVCDFVCVFAVFSFYFGLVLLKT